MASSGRIFYMPFNFEPRVADYAEDAWSVNLTLDSKAGRIPYRSEKQAHVQCGAALLIVVIPSTARASLLLGSAHHLVTFTPTRTGSMGHELTQGGLDEAIGNLNENISHERLAVEQTLDDEPHKPVMLNNLAQTLYSRYDLSDELGDLDSAISYGRLAAVLTPEDHPNRPLFLDNLGTFFQRRFTEVGELDDLESAISMKQRAVDLIHNSSPHKPLLLMSVGESLYSRFDRLGQVSDLDDAIAFERLAIELMQVDAQ